MQNNTPINATTTNRPLQMLSTFMMAVVSSVLLMNSATATPGHDHAANESMLMHLMFYGSIVLAVAAGVWFAYKTLAARKDKNL